VASLVGAADPALSRALTRVSPEGDQPLPFLFQPLLLQLKREMKSFEEARRMWEACWASEEADFHLLVLSALLVLYISIYLSICLSIYRSI